MELGISLAGWRQDALRYRHPQRRGGASQSQFERSHHDDSTARALPVALAGTSRARVLLAGAVGRCPRRWIDHLLLVALFDRAVVHQIRRGRRRALRFSQSFCNAQRTLGPAAPIGLGNNCPLCPDDLWLSPGLAICAGRSPGAQAEIPSLVRVLRGEWSNMPLSHHPIQHARVGDRAGSRFLSIPMAISRAVSCALRAAYRVPGTTCATEQTFDVFWRTAFWDRDLHSPTGPRTAPVGGCLWRHHTAHHHRGGAGRTVARHDVHQ